MTKRILQNVLAGLAIGVSIFQLASPPAVAEERSEVDLSGAGWKLWRDQAAQWEQDKLYLPPVDVSLLPVHPPTGGWNILDSAPAKNVAVPGTVEEYLQEIPGPDGDITGVSWWYRPLHVPEATSPRRVLLRFESVRQRAEVYVNGKLTGYDVVGNTPFEVDLSDAVRPGETCQLAVRITDPGGNFDWRDGRTIQWGQAEIPGSHGFGGITGRVKLICCDPVYVDDVYVQNTPAITQANAEITIRNRTAVEARRDVVVRVMERQNPSAEIFRRELKEVKLAPGENVIPVKMSAPNARLWDMEHPNLYVCKVELKTGDRSLDAAEQMFGFRWFAPEGFGTNAMFRLNGRRIVLRSAISWGFWPVNGIYATPAMAEKQIRTAREMGLNMLNFHRCIGQPIVLEKADELGLLYYEEPGNYRSAGDDPFAQALAREKLLRMVRRDRSHPSLVIYNLINEAAPVEPELLQVRQRDLRDAHALDPSRTITHTSAWAGAPDVDDQSKMHLRPFDDTIHMNGWYDFHHAGGPPVWNQNLYQNPNAFYNHTTNAGEIVFWGEEGAISTPPRLEKIKADLDVSPDKGWDGGLYLEWYQSFTNFMTRKNLRAAFPTLEALTSAMGDVSLEHQGRKIENIRISNLTDGYVINGWESEIIENHSGVVDCFRNPKGNPAITAYYNQPLYVAVKVRSQILQIPGEAVVDFYAINEKNLNGPHTLKIAAKDPSGKVMFRKEAAVSLAGGDVYGQLLVEGVRIPVADTSGMFRIEASLVNPAGRAVARGHDEVFAVDWKSAPLRGKGAVWESGNQIHNFLKNRKGLDVPAYEDSLGHLDWLIASRSPNAGDLTVIPANQFLNPSGKGAGLVTTFFARQNFEQPVYQRMDSTVNLTVPEGATPDPNAPLMNNYSVRWEGRLIPPVTGGYDFAIQTGGNARLVINGRAVIAGTESEGQGRIELEAGKPATITVELQVQRRTGRCKLMWSVPNPVPLDLEHMMTRVRRDGTTLLILNHADLWMNLIKTNVSVAYGGSFRIGTAWLGGQHFVRPHPLFKDLPVNCGMNWPYQAIVRNGNERSGLLLEGEELVVGAWHSYPMQLGTAVGVVPCGKGRIIVSTLDICDNLPSDDGPAQVARKLLCNFLEFAETR